MRRSTGKRRKSVPSPRDIPGAAEAALPQKLPPQLATLAATFPTRGDWHYEIKLDGYRIMTRFDRGKPVLITRGGHDWSAKLPTLIDELKALGIDSGWLDGEIVVQGPDGRPDFNALQNSLDSTRSGNVVYFLFDVPFLEGYDLRQTQLRRRRQLLESILDDNAGAHIRLSDTFGGDPTSILQSACRMGLEGIIAKRADAAYSSRRTEDWLKFKCKHRQEFVVVGYTDRSDGSGEIGSLILAVYEDGALVPVGSVGTGWSSREATALKQTLAEDLQVREIGNVMVATGLVHVELVNKGTAAKFDIRYSAIYANQGDQWRLVHIQNARMPPAKT